MVIKHAWIFYLLSFTWGILVTLAGCITTLALLITGHKPEKNAYGWLFTLGKNWGGVSIGPCRIVSKASYNEYVIKHEFGHSIQNCFYGPFMIFLVVIPSSIRYWYYTYKEYKHETDSLKPYNSIWFEHQANVLGEINYKENKL